MHPIPAGLLRDILEYPDEDAPRLICADWCEDNGRPERAEFIRVQVEYAARSPCEECLALLGRSLDLLREHGLAWTRRLLPLARDGIFIIADGQHAPDLPGVVVYRRGFAEQINCTLADLEHGRAHNTARRLFSGAPVRGIRIFGSEPDRWFRQTRYVWDASVPRWLFAHLAQPGSSRSRIYTTREAALADLDAAALAWGRSLAGLATPGRAFALKTPGRVL